MTGYTNKKGRVEYSEKWIGSPSNKNQIVAPLSNFPHFS